MRAFLSLLLGLSLSGTGERISFFMREILRRMV